MKKFFTVLLVVVLIAAVPLGIHFIPQLFKKDRESNVPGTEVGKAIYAIQKTCERNYEIVDDYESSSVSNVSTSKKFASTDDVTEEMLTKYFNAFGISMQIPTVLEYVVNSSSSNVYSNTFELGQNYYASDVLGNGTYYYRVVKNGNLVTMYLQFENQQIICQIKYDFEKDKLIFAKTMASGLMAYIDYSMNSLTFVMFGQETDLDKILAGDYTFEDITNPSSTQLYLGNIAKNINSIEIEEFTLADTGMDLEFNRMIKDFAFGGNTTDAIDEALAIRNNSLEDAINYSMQRAMFVIRQRGFEFECITTWIGYDKLIDMLNKLMVEDSFTTDQTTRDFIKAFRNRIVDRGEGSYVGDTTFTRLGNTFSIQKLTDDVEAYLVSVNINGVVTEYCFQYKNGTITNKNDEYLITTFEVEESDDGTYAIITGATTNSIEMTIPETYNVGGKDLPVKSIGGDYYFYFSARKPIILNIPKTVEEISLGSEYIMSIKVEEENSNFCSVDGILYSKDKTTVYKVPAYLATKDVVLEEGVTHIDYDACDWLETVESITFPSTYVEDFYGNAFWGSFSLKNYYVASGNTAYYDNDGIIYSRDGKEFVMCPPGRTGKVNIMAGVETIKDSAFTYCRYVSEITLPGTIKTIENGAFTYCESITTLTLPDSLQTIPSGFSFHGFDSLTTVNISQNNQVFFSVGGMVYSKDMTKFYFCPRDKEGEVTIIDGVVEIVEGAFNGCKKITNVRIPETVAKIGDYAFAYSSIKNVTIEGTVAIEHNVFFRSSLTELTIGGLVDIQGRDYGFDWSAIDECDNLTTIRFGGSIADWQASVSDDFDYYDEWIPAVTIICSDGNLYI